MKPDVVFFDMPGTLRSNGVIKTLSQMDALIPPSKISGLCLLYTSSRFSFMLSISKTMNRLLSRSMFSVELSRKS